MLYPNCIEVKCIKNGISHALKQIFANITPVNVYVDVVVFTRIAGTSYTGSGRYWC